MIPDILLNNLVPWAVQVLVIGSIGALLPLVLRIRHPRPHCRNAKDGDELAPLQVTKLHTRPLAKGVHDSIPDYPRSVRGPLWCRISVRRMSASGEQRP